MAHTLSIELPEGLYDLLVKMAQETGQPPETLAVAWLVAAAQRTAQDDPLEPFIGAFDTGIKGWTARHDEYLGRTLLDDHAGHDPQD